jgi:hypothetical protein
MGIRVEVKKIVYESITMEAINPEYLGITRDQIEDYLKKAYAVGRGMPDDPAYTREDLIHDLIGSSGFYCLPIETKPETDDFIATMLNDLL